MAMQVAEVGRVGGARNEVNARRALPRAVASWGCVFCATFLLYFVSASRSIQWDDQGEYVSRIFKNDIRDPIGLCCYHPLHFFLGRAALSVLPFAPPFALSLVSALAGAITVASVFGLIRSLGNQAIPAFLAAAGLAFAHTFWRMSTTVEVYTISAALLTAELWALSIWDRTRQRRWLVLMMLANGVGFANHDLALLTLPVVGVVLLAAIWKRQAGPGTFIVAVATWLIGASPYIAFIAHEAVLNGAGSALHSALFGTVEDEVLGIVMRLAFTGISVAFTLLSFPNLTLFASAVGIIFARGIGVPRLTYRALMAALLIHLAFVLRYGVVDQYTFLVPSYAVIAIFAGFGYAKVLKSGQRARLVALAALLIALTPVEYVGATAVARHSRISEHWNNHKPYRDHYRYFFIPWGRGENSAARMSEQAVSLAAPNGLIIAEDGMGLFALNYEVNVRRLRNVKVVDWASEADITGALRASRPVVLVPSNTTVKSAFWFAFKWKRVGELYFLEP
jgi:hypothetical protein